MNATNTKNHIVLSPYTQKLMKRVKPFSQSGDMFTCCTMTGRYYVSFRYYHPKSNVSERFQFYTPPRTGRELVRQVRNAFISGVKKGMFKTKDDLERFAARMEKEMEKHKTKAPYYTRNQQSTGTAQ